MMTPAELAPYVAFMEAHHLVRIVLKELDVEVTLERPYLPPPPPPMPEAKDTPEDLEALLFAAAR